MTRHEHDRVAAPGSRGGGGCPAVGESRQHRVLALSGPGVAAPPCVRSRS